MILKLKIIHLRKVFSQTSYNTCASTYVMGRFVNATHLPLTRSNPKGQWWPLMYEHPSIEQEKKLIIGTLGQDTL